MTLTGVIALWRRGWRPKDATSRVGSTSTENSRNPQSPLGEIFRFIDCERSTGIAWRSEALVRCAELASTIRARAIRGGRTLSTPLEVPWDTGNPRHFNRPRVKPRLKGSNCGIPILET